MDDPVMFHLLYGSKCLNRLEVIEIRLIPTDAENAMNKLYEKISFKENTKYKTKKYFLQ